MNNTTIQSNTTQKPIKYLSKNQWFEVYRSFIQQEIDISLIPIGLFGVILNILALIVLHRSDRFNLPFYTYLKAYTSASLFICLINSTQFTAGARTILPFTNSIESARYYSFIFYPFQTIINVYGSFLDIVLSMERVVLLSKKFEWFRKIHPIVLCFIFFMIAFSISSPYFVLLREYSLELNLNKTTTFMFYGARASRYYSDIRDYLFKLPYVVEIFPIVMETGFNILSVYLIREYNKNKIRVIGNGVNRGDVVTRGVAITKPAHSIPIAPAVPSQRSEVIRAKRMEIKLTILVIVLSVLSTM
jgi:hypothetical protein